VHVVNEQWLKQCYSRKRVEPVDAYLITSLPAAPAAHKRHDAADAAHALASVPWRDPLQPIAVNRSVLAQKREAPTDNPQAEAAQLEARSLHEMACTPAQPRSSPTGISRSVANSTSPQPDSQTLECHASQRSALGGLTSEDRGASPRATASSQQRADSVPAGSVSDMPACDEGVDVPAQRAVMTQAVWQRQAQAPQIEQRQAQAPQTKHYQVIDPGNSCNELAGTVAPLSGQPGSAHQVDAQSSSVHRTSQPASFLAAFTAAVDACNGVLPAASPCVAGPAASPAAATVPAECGSARHRMVRISIRSPLSSFRQW
jgi:hypothetical protein